MHYYSFILTDFFEGLHHGHYPRQCEICKKYFLMTSARKQKYCNGIAPYEYNGEKMTCRQYAVIMGKKEKVDAHPILSIHKKRCNCIRAELSKGTITKEFATADTIVIAAPYWDLSFPAVLKLYLENISVVGVTFRYSENGVPVGLCRANKLIYVTTAGGYIGENDFGFSYVKSLAQNLYGIKNTECVAAEGLDIAPEKAEGILSHAMSKIKQ